MWSVSADVETFGARRHLVEELATPRRVGSTRHVSEVLHECQAVDAEVLVAAHVSASMVRERRDVIELPSSAERSTSPARRSSSGSRPRVVEIWKNPYQPCTARRHDGELRSHAAGQDRWAGQLGQAALDAAEGANSPQFGLRRYSVRKTSTHCRRGRGWERHADGPYSRHVAHPDPTRVVPGSAVDVAGSHRMTGCGEGEMPVEVIARSPPAYAGPAPDPSSRSGGIGDGGVQVDEDRMLTDPDGVVPQLLRSPRPQPPSASASAPDPTPNHPIGSIATRLACAGAGLRAADVVITSTTTERHDEPTVR
jgi:hypothetical protein